MMMMIAIPPHGYPSTVFPLHLSGERQYGVKFLNVQGNNKMTDLALKPLNFRSEAQCPNCNITKLHIGLKDNSIIN